MEVVLFKIRKFFLVKIFSGKFEPEVDGTPGGMSFYGEF
jgi:hypothetical protein